MSKTKLILCLAMIVALFTFQVGVVMAAPSVETSEPITGTVQSITLETDTEGVTTVLVTVEEDGGTTQTVRISVDTAVELGLVTLDTEGNPVVNEASIGTTITINPAAVISNEETEGEQHPVASALEEFFSETLGVDYETIMSVHEDGVGFGVIAQALWLTQALDGDTELFNTIIKAKVDHDFSSITLENGTTPKNWGQFRKALLDHKQNLGQIMSGHAENGSGETGGVTTDSGKSHGKGQGKGRANGHKK
jgi:hypothetical protein